MAIRVTLLILGSLAAWLLYSKGEEIGWMGGIIFALAGMAIGLISLIAVIAISINKSSRNKERSAVSAAFIIVAIGLLILGASRMIAWD
jgi:uncharacterized membrane protein YqjE